MSARFSKPVLAVIHESRILGIRAGIRPHRFIGIWAVVIDGRVFVRPWNDKPGGWYRAFRVEPRGRIHIPPGREIPVRARQVRGERLIDAVDRAYAEKYITPASRKLRGRFSHAQAAEDDDRAAAALIQFPKQAAQQGAPPWRPWSRRTTEAG